MATLSKYLVGMMFSGTIFADCSVHYLVNKPVFANEPTLIEESLEKLANHQATKNQYRDFVNAFQAQEDLRLILEKNPAGLSIEALSVLSYSQPIKYLGELDEAVEAGIRERAQGFLKGRAFVEGQKVLKRTRESLYGTEHYVGRYEAFWDLKHILFTDPQVVPPDLLSYLAHQPPLKGLISNATSNLLAKNRALELLEGRKFLKPDEVMDRAVSDIKKAQANSAYGFQARAADGYDDLKTILYTQPEKLSDEALAILAKGEQTEYLQPLPDLAYSRARATQIIEQRALTE